MLANGSIQISTDHKQKMIIDGTVLKEHYIDFGVPQGAALG